jgi:hypothetical protein
MLPCFSLLAGWVGEETGGLLALTLEEPDGGRLTGRINPGRASPRQQTGEMEWNYLRDC